MGLISSTPNNSLAFEVVSPAGERKLVDAGTPFYWAWAPDGHTVLAHAGGASSIPGARLSLLQLGPSVTEQSFGLPPAEFRAPAFSPNGRQVLVATAGAADGQAALVLTDRRAASLQTLAEYDGTQASPLCGAPTARGWLTWLADSPLGATGHLVVVDPAGKQKPVELAGSDVLAFFWSPDSKSLAYFTQAQPSPDATDTVNASHSTANNSDGPLILALSVLDARSGKVHSVATYPPSERFLAVIPYFDQYHAALTIWSPDSKNLVISAYGSDGTPGIWVVEASGHLDPRFVTEGWLGFWSWH